MKQHQKWFEAVLAVASGLVIVSSAQAQPWQTPPPAGVYTTTVLSDFGNNFTLSAQYASWAPFPAGNATITSGAAPGSFEVAGTSYGSGSYDLPGGPVNAAGAMYAQLTFTVHDSGFGNTA